MYLEVKPQSGIPWENSPLGMAYDGFPLCQTSCRLLFSRRMIRWSDKHEPNTTIPRIQRTSVTQVA